MARVRRQRGSVQDLGDGPIDFEVGLAGPEIRRPVADRDAVHKRGAGGRSKAAGIDFDEGLPVVDLRKSQAPEPETVEKERRDAQSGLAWCDTRGI